MSSLALAPVPESISAAVGAAERGASVSGLSAEAQSRVGLAVAEAVANAIEHGDPGGKVSVGIQQTEDGLSVEVCDGGSGVCEDRLRSATLPSDPFQTHGRGLYLMRVLSDGCEVVSGCVRLRFRERSG